MLLFNGKVGNGLGTPPLQKYIYMTVLGQTASSGKPHYCKIKTKLKI